MTTIVPYSTSLRNIPHIPRSSLIYRSDHLCLEGSTLLTCGITPGSSLTVGHFSHPRVDRLCIKISLEGSRTPPRHYVYLLRDSLVSELRRQVSTLMNVPLIRTNLFSLKSLLEDRFTLAHYRMNSESVVSLFVHHLDANCTVVAFRKFHSGSLKSLPVHHGTTTHNLLLIIAQECHFSLDGLFVCHDETGLILLPQSLASQFAIDRRLVVRVCSSADTLVSVDAQKVVDNPPYVLEVNNNDSFRDLKRKMAERVKVPAGRLIMSLESDDSIPPDNALLGQYSRDSWRFILTSRAPTDLYAITQFGPLPVDEAGETISEIKAKFGKSQLNFDVFSPAAEIRDLDSSLRDLRFPYEVSLLIVPHEEEEELVAVKLALEGGVFEIKLPGKATVADARMAFEALGTFGKGRYRMFCNGLLIGNDDLLISQLEGNPERILYYAR
jgi:hypothetical protein